MFNDQENQLILPNPPNWPDSVLIFSDTDTDINERIIQKTGHLQVQPGHFSDDRFALLFKSGTYNTDVQVGYYVQVLGLGKNVSDVNFISKNGVYCPCIDKGGAGSLDTFWRSAENFTTNHMLWAVSQASPLRRLHIKENLLLHDCGQWASGGYLSDLIIDKNTEMGSQQQWYSQNSEFGKSPSNNVWNFVYTGCKGAPETKYRTDSNDIGVFNVNNTPLCAAKPFIRCDDNNNYYLEIPEVLKNNNGVTYNLPNKSINFNNVYVANPDIDNDSTIQYYLNRNCHIVLTPGIYKFNNSIIPIFDNQVILGIGLATLVGPTNGKPCIYVPSKLRNIRIAGLMLQASKLDGTIKKSDSCLLTIGEKNNTETPDENNVSAVLSDIFIRVGGSDLDRGVSTDTMVKIHSNFVIIDHLWAWVSDHSKLLNGEVPLPKEKYHLVQNGEFSCNIGLHVTGNNVFAYGLFVEHCDKYMVYWEGDKGQTYFYQSEFAYHINEYYGKMDYCSYYVSENVEEHLCIGGGAYSFCRDYECIITSGFECPIKPGIKFYNVFTRYLNGNNGIKSVINGEGQEVGKDDHKKKLASIDVYPISLV
jgi:hypothetical protein